MSRLLPPAARFAGTVERAATSVFIVGLAPQKNYISVCVNAVEDGRYLAENYAARLGKVKVGKSAVSFTRLADIDLDVLQETVARAAQIMRQ